MEEGLQLVKIGEGMALLLELKVAVNGVQQGFRGVLAFVESTDRVLDASGGAHPCSSRWHDATEFLAGGKGVEIGLWIELVFFIGLIAPSLLCPLLDEQTDEGGIGCELEQCFDGHWCSLVY